MKRIFALMVVFSILFSCQVFALEPLADANVEISTMATSGGKIYWGTRNWSSTTGHEAKRGSEFTLEARETTGTFLYWKDVKTSKILSYDKIYTFVAVDDVNIQAMFVYNSYLGTNGYVTFADKDGTILVANYFGEGESADKPTTIGLKSAGYTFTGWDTDEWENVKAGDITLVTAQYDKKDATYSVSVKDGAIVPMQASYDYDDFVTVFADKSKIPQGKYLAGWKMNGQLVTEEETYSFYVGANCDLEPVYKDSEVTATPVCAIVDVDSSIINNRVSVLISRNVPEGYTLIESGLLHADSSFTGELLYDSPSKQKAVALSKDPDGMFRFNVNMSGGTSGIARAYVVYKYEDALYISYSNQVTITK